MAQIERWVAGKEKRDHGSEFEPDQVDCEKWPEARLLGTGELTT